ncbi:MAG: sigma-70 family RNA polymerase sigma factor, partial [Verrucomicrobia bacterium]|nr:sigma-70 family RNA polymerase sigma factor [Verrucomicrobiota bacterium]
RALDHLAREMEASGKAPTFALLKPWLTGASTLPHSEAATQLNLSPGTLKVTIYRLRQRFRELVRHEIASTVATPDEIDTEVRYLVEVLSS